MPELRRKYLRSGLTDLEESHRDPIHHRAYAPGGHHRLHQGAPGFAGRADPLFSEDAIKVIHQAPRGYPRTVNNLALAGLMATRAAQGAIVDQSAEQSAVSEFTE